MESMKCSLHFLSSICSFMFDSQLFCFQVDGITLTITFLVQNGKLNNYCIARTISVISVQLFFVFQCRNFLNLCFICRPLLGLPSFWMVITLSGFLGLAISFTSMWFLHQTGATTYRYGNFVKLL